MGLTERIYQKSPIFLQTMLLNAKAFELYLERYGAKFHKLYEEFDRNQWLSGSDLAAYQEEKLRHLIRHAYETVPFYRKSMERQKLVPADIRTVDDLRKMPILTRNDIKTHYKELISNIYMGIWIRHGHTSGTTGSPLDICYDINTCVAHHVADWRQKHWAGLQYGVPYASIQGRVVVPIDQREPPFWRKNYINNQLFLSSFHLNERNIPFYFDKLQKDNIKFIEGYPSTLYILSLYLRKQNSTFPLRAVLTSSETLFDFQSKTIEEAFCCKIFDFYGMAERAVFATECDQHRGRHLNSDYGITEFLDSNDEPLGHGRLGRIVATSLHNHAMPLIRYQTNDSSSQIGESCNCGRGFPLMEGVTTKNESIVTLPDGRLISPSVLTHPFKPLNSIEQSQIIQETKNKLTVRIVRRDNYDQKDERLLINGFIERLGKNIVINIEYVESLNRVPGKKFKWVISKVIPHF